jgi:hypothetical protein
MYDNAVAHTTRLQTAYLLYGLIALFDMLPSVVFRSTGEILLDPRNEYVVMDRSGNGDRRGENANKRENELITNFNCTL